MEQQTMTLGDINKTLAQIGIMTTLTPTGAEALRVNGVRDSFINALKQAPRNAGAKTWIYNTLNTLGVTAENRQGGAQQQRSLFDSYSNNGERTPPPSEEAPRVRDRVTHHVYGGKGALCFEMDETRDLRPTVALDAAQSIGPKQYGWANKIRIQMTVNELPEVAAVLFGFQQKCEFKNHGPDNNKGFSIERQQGQFFVRVFTKGANVAVPMYAPDAYHVAVLVLRQLQALSPWMSGDAITASLRGTAAVHAHRQSLHTAAPSE